MMTSRNISIGLLAIAVLGIVFWKSPFAIGLKLKCATKNYNGPMLLDASNQLLSFRSDDQSALRQAIDIKLKVAEGEVVDAARIINEMIAKNPDDPGLLIARARIHVMGGHLDQALIDLSKVKGFALRGSSGQEFAPSPTLIDEMIERIRNQVKLSNSAP
jgi:hypothetical protein